VHRLWLLSQELNQLEATAMAIELV